MRKVRDWRAWLNVHADEVLEALGDLHEELFDRIAAMRRQLHEQEQRS
jgi:hypothetical protein